MQNNAIGFLNELTIKWFYFLLLFRLLQPQSVLELWKLQN